MSADEDSAHKAADGIDGHLSESWLTNTKAGDASLRFFVYNQVIRLLTTVLRTQPQMSSKRQNVVVACRTYNLCASAIIEKFGLTLSGKLKPSQRFNRALNEAWNKFNTTTQDKRDLELADISENLIRSTLETLAIDIILKSEQNRKRRSITRMALIRRLCKRLQQDYGLKEFKLHVKAKKGNYSELNYYLRWLFKRYPGTIEYAGSKPQDKIYFNCS